MDSKQVASAQIEIILSTLKQVEHLSFPKASLITYGVLIGLVPLFEVGLGFLPFHSVIGLHLVFYGILFGLARYVLIKHFDVWKSTPTHPVAARALLSQQKFALVSGVVCSIALAHAGRFELIFPIITAHLASLFYTFGKFSSRNLRRMAYLQVGLAALSIEVFSHEFGMTTFPIFTTLLALTFIGGAFLR